MPASFSKICLFPPATLPAYDIIFMCPVLTSFISGQEYCMSCNVDGSGEAKVTRKYDDVYISGLRNEMHLMYVAYFERNKRLT